MADLASLQVQLELQSAQFTQGMNDVQRQILSLNKQVSGAEKFLTDLGKTLAVAFAGQQTVDAFKRIIDGMDDMSKAAQKVGVSVESLSALKFAAEQSGVSFEGLQAGLKKLSQNMQDVENSTSTAGKALKALGVTGADTADQALAKIADGFASVPDGAQKTALALQLLGKQGAELIPFLNAGAGGIEELKKRAKELGIVLNGDTTKQAEAFNDALGELQAAGQGVLTKIVQGMLPALQQLAVGLAGATSTGPAWTALGTVIGGVIKAIASGVLVVVGVLTALGKQLGGILASNAALLRGDFAGAWEIVKSSVMDTGDVIGDTAKNIKALWVEAAPPPEVAKNAAETEKNAKNMGAAFKQLTDDGKKSAAAVKEAKAELDPLQKTLEKLFKDAQAQREAGGVLAAISTPAMQEALKAAGIDSHALATEMEHLRIAAGGAKAEIDPLTVTLEGLFKGAAERREAGSVLAAISTPEMVATLKAAGISTQELADATERLKGIADPEGAAQAKRNAALIEQGRALELAANPIATYTKRVEELNVMLNASAISSTTFNAEVGKAGKTLAEGLNPATEKSIDLNKLWQDSLATVVASGIDQLSEALMGNASSFEDWAASVIKSIAQALIKIALLRLAIMALEAYSPGSSKLLGLAAKAKGAAYTGGGLEFFAKGGAFHNNVLMRPTMFAQGGMWGGMAVAGEAGPEAVVPLRRTTGGNLGVEASPVVVNVNNTISDRATVDVTETNRKDGTKEINVTIRRELKAALSDGSMDASLRGNYGVARRAVG